MINKNVNQTISFTSFKEFPELLCLVSTRRLGDMNIGKGIRVNAKTLLDLIHIDIHQLVGMNQIHGLNVTVVDSSQANTMAIKTDALITGATGLFLGVNTADCVPVFFYDPIKKLVAVAHSGWKGTQGNFMGKVTSQFIELGSDLTDVRVAIGPHIGGCCYNVEKDREERFRSLFNDSRVVFTEDDKNYIDLGMANKLQLIAAGVLQEHIDAPIMCTSCQNDLFFSFRNDSEKTIGEMLGLIGLKY